MVDVYKLTPAPPVNDNRITMPITEGLVKLSKLYGEMEDLYGVGNVKIVAWKQDGLMEFAKTQGLETEVDPLCPPDKYFVMQKRFI